MATNRKPEEKNGTTNVATTYEFPQPKEKVTFLEFLYNRKNGTILGRTGKSWGQILFFYLIFYIVLSALFAICMEVLFATLHDNRPKWTLNDSLIGSNPGLGFRPLAKEIDQGSIIRFDTKNPSEIKYWIDRLELFLKPYENQTGLKPCSYTNKKHNESEVCDVPINHFDECAPSNNYGYQSMSPCVFLKLNRIIGWLPEVMENQEDFPEDMPEELQTHVLSLMPHERKQVWVSCEGKYSHDREALNVIRYFPSRGFQSYYYPYMNQPNYLSPLIAVQFVHPTPGRLINIECKAWAKNIDNKVYKQDRKGSVLFEIMIDS